MPERWVSINAVLGGIVVTIGLWLLVGALPVIVAVGLALALAAVMAWRCPTIMHVWAVSTLLLGMESLIWPVLEMVAAKQLGPNPPLEELQRLFTAVLFGLFSGVFWLTFSYGLYKRARASQSDTTASVKPGSVRPGKNQQDRKRNASLRDR